MQNVTDVDDPLLERAVATGQDWRELARSETALFAEDMAALNVPAAAGLHRGGGVDPLGGAVDRAAARRRRGVRRGRRPVLHDLGGRRGSARSPGSTRPRCARSSPSVGATPPGRASAPRWTACSGRPRAPTSRRGTPTLGHGRPGWHIECTAIALDHLGMGFDVQGGGSDLAFPHHEMCAAQAGIATGESPFAEHFVHAGMVGYEGHKMSKSRGNLVFVSRLRRAGVPLGGRPPGPAGPPLPQRLGVDPGRPGAGRAPRAARGARACRRPVGPVVRRAAGRGARADRRRPRRPGRAGADRPAGPRTRSAGWARIAMPPGRSRVLLDTLLGVDLS